jgi:hypothetical protein
VTDDRYRDGHAPLPPTTIPLSKSDLRRLDALGHGKIEELAAIVRERDELRATALKASTAAGEERLRCNALEKELNDARNAVRIYGGHIPNCHGVNCTCGFREAWVRHAEKAIHPGKKA